MMPQWGCNLLQVKLLHVSSNFNRVFSPISIFAICSYFDAQNLKKLFSDFNGSSNKEKLPANSSREQKVYIYIYIYIYFFLNFQLTFFDNF